MEMRARGAHGEHYVTSFHQEHQPLPEPCNLVPVKIIMVSSGDSNYGNFHSIKKYFHASTINPTEDGEELQLYTVERLQRERLVGVSAERLCRVSTGVNQPGRHPIFTMSIGMQIAHGFFWLMAWSLGHFALKVC